MDEMRDFSWFERGKFYAIIRAGMNLSAGDLISVAPCEIQVVEGHPLLAFVKNFAWKQAVEIWSVFRMNPEIPISRDLESSIKNCTECVLGEKITQESPEMASEILRAVLIESKDDNMREVVLRILPLTAENFSLISSVIDDSNENLFLREVALRKLDYRIPLHKKKLRMVFNKYHSAKGPVELWSLAARRLQGFDSIEPIPFLGEKATV